MAVKLPDTMEKHTNGGRLCSALAIGFILGLVFNLPRGPAAKPQGNVAGTVDNRGMMGYMTAPEQPGAMEASWFS